jgi:ATP-dependent 26S proteasome regulatory subunit
LATTNHPDRIDSAIIDRPSRFDRKYHFRLPSTAERHDFLAAWQQKLTSETGWQAAEVEPIADQTVGFSFAYLKEMVVSTVMKWLQSTEEPFANAVKSQAELLRKQMKTSDT